MQPKTVAVVGYKDSGKTLVVGALTKELTRRGYGVGTIKHTADNIILDTPGKDTSRHRDAGSQATAILKETEAALFLDRHLTLQQAAALLAPIDFLLIEGFKSLNTHPRIIVPRDNREAKELRNGLELAVVKTPGSKFDADVDIPVLTSTQSEELADIVEARSYPLLPGLNCKTCGYSDCKSMGAALLRGEADIKQCVGFSAGVMLRVNNQVVPLNQFTQTLMKNVILGFLKTLKGVEYAGKVEIGFEQ